MSIGVNIKKFFTKKRIIWTVIILLIVGPIVYGIVKPKNNSANIQTDTVKKQDLKLTVLATGQVVSSTDLNLSFKTSGVVNKINIKEGDKVKAGAILAVLDQKDVGASYTSAQGSLAAAQANYQKVLAGSSNQQIAVAQKALDAANVNLNTAKTSLANVKQQQVTAVANAYSALMNSTISAVPATGNIGTASITVSGTYTSKDQGVYTITVDTTGGSGQFFHAQGLESAAGQVKSVPVALGNRGLFIQFTGTPSTGDTWTITLPNTSASTYVANYNAYQTALNTQQSSVDSAQASVDSAQAAAASAQANLDLQTAQARPADVQAAQAQILSAQGQVQAAAAALDNTLIRAPADGTITSVDVKVGELASALKEVIVLQDVGDLHAEADVSEANIADLKPDQTVDITFDALGPDRHFTGTVQTVNPGATVVSGVVNYKVKASINNAPDIKPGMTANMTILVGQKSSVLAVPSRAILGSDGNKTVRVIDDPKKKTYHEVTVQTGMDADGGVTEITSGLNEGQEIVTFIKQ